MIRVVASEVAVSEALVSDDVSCRGANSATTRSDSINQWPAAPTCCTSLLLERLLVG